QAEDGIRDLIVTGVQTCALPIYHVVRHIHVGGMGGWDYVSIDSASRRLFVSHSDRVEVVDIEQGKVIGTIPKTEGVHGIALAPRSEERRVGKEGRCRRARNE